MREPGEDDGEYWQLSAPPQAHPLDKCACPKAEGHYGTRGWHFNEQGAAYERCPAYPTKTRGGAAHGKRRTGGRT